MESFASSPNYARPTSRFDGRKENSPGGSECDDNISVTSSTCESAINVSYTQKLNNKNNGIKHRATNKKTLKTFGNVRSFRRRAKPRIVHHSPITISDEDSLVDSPHSSPHYLKKTTSSEGKKMRAQTSHTHPESSFDGSERSISHLKLASPGPRPFQALARTPSFRSVRILVKKSSFKPKRSSLSYAKVSVDAAAVDRATYSSTLKDSKFPETVEVHSGTIEPEKSSAMKVCRYHHCSLHGHCHGNDEPAPPPKHFMYLRRRSLKKQRSIVPRTELRAGGKNSGDKKKNLLKSPIAPITENVENENVVDSHEEKFHYEEARPLGDGYKDIQETYADLFEVAFGETSFPERSYQENLDIVRRYSSPEQDFGGTSFGRNSYCLSCSCQNRVDVSLAPRRAESANVLCTSSRVFFEKPNEYRPETPAVSDEVTEKKSESSSASAPRTSTDSNSEEEVESTTTGDSNVDAEVRVEDSEIKSPVQTGGKLHFSKPRHISMWHLIQQHMSSNRAMEPTTKLGQGAEGESPVESADPLPVKESTAPSRDLADADANGINNDSETQEIEMRKLLAIKLVREAIEKILLPEVQDQASDDQSVTSESSSRSQLVENDQSRVSDAQSGEGDSSSNPKEVSAIADDACGRQIREPEEQVVRKSEKKPPKHWSNLKKWILLQRFIRELEKVKKFNTRKPRNLPLKPDPETEKVNLRPQTVDERKNAEEWMLDFAIRQAVSQLAPTQKRKVSLLVKAFETVVPPQEESQVQLRTPRPRDRSSNGEGIGEFTSIEKSVSLLRSCTSMDRLPESKEENPRETGGHHMDSPLVQKDTVKVGNIIEKETEKWAMPTLQGLHEDAISGITEGKVKDGGQCNQMDRKNYIKTWHMIYQHVVSGIAERVGSQLLDGSEDDVLVENGNSNGVSQPTDDSSEENHISSKNLRGGLTKSDALKLVKEAVDEILLPEIQDDVSDTQLVTSESVPDEDVSEKILSEDGKEMQSESQVGKKNELPKPKNWSKLKKLILLKRSIKALEKARKVKPQPIQSLVQTPDLEPEKIDLRRQMMDERKKAEQWMVDYAVQHIVTKLTPARKRRVSMLVEAFEAVVPLPEI